MPVKWDFFQQANKTEVQGFKTCKTLTQQHKHAIAEASLRLSLLKKFCSHLATSENLYTSLPTVKCYSPTSSEKFISDFYLAVHKLHQPRNPYGSPSVLTISFQNWPNS